MAYIIGLIASEFDQWLTHTQETYLLANSQTISASQLTATHELSPGQQVKIPNIIFCAFFGDEGHNYNVSPEEKSKWQQRKDELREVLGFSVWEHDNDRWGNGSACSPAVPYEPFYHSKFNPNGTKNKNGTGYYAKMRGMWIEGNLSGTSWVPSPRSMSSKEKFISNYQRAVSRKGLHGFFIYGHGSPNIFGTTYNRYRIFAFAEERLDKQVACIGPPVGVSYSEIKQKTPYGLGAVIIYACYGDGSEGEDLLQRR